MATRPVNVLCLDGGGVRGLSSLLILRHLMQRLGTSSNQPMEPLPCEVFDIICGTSTGGIIALMLGRLRMNVEDAITCYLDFSKTVFEQRRTTALPQRFLRLWNRLSHKSLPIYDASKLEKWIKDIVAKYTDDEEALLRDPLDGTDKICRTFVVATTQVYANAPPKLFRTYRSEQGPANPCKIWEAARATTAATPFFSPATFGSPQATYIDGSFSGSNNPSRLAIDEARTVLPSRQIGCFLSLGTGVPDIITIGGGFDQITKACMELVKCCEGVHNTVWKNFFQRKKADAHAGVYFRFSVDRGLGKVELDEWNRVEELTGITDGYMRHNEVEEKAETCVRELTEAVEVAAKKQEEVELV